MATKIFEISENTGNWKIKAIAWKVEKSKDFPEGIKYAFAYIVNNKRVIGYDNERTKGHHRHFLKEDGSLGEEKTGFRDIKETHDLFIKEIYEFKNKHEGKQNSNKDTK